MKQDFHIPTDVQQLINAEQAYHYRIIPVSKGEGALVFKTDNTNFAQLQSELLILLGLNVTLTEDTPENINKYLSTNYRKSSSDKVSEIHYSNDFLEKILISAKETGSSDIHFEPYELKARVRFRLDGKLKEQFFIDNDEYPIIVNKIKIRAQLDISEKRLPQDGRITIATDYEDFDIRVSVLPTLHGEKIVLRILSKDTSHIDLASVGFTDNELKTYLEGIKKPNGIVLISGPTGSGKTTTLYATLKKLNQPNTNILTVEDPIEYTLEGINQVQLKENIGLDFAATLRTFLRQDPDIIMVGEIRDVNTANMAIRAALTGHLVLSTIHTNSAWATISRLIDMGVPPFLIASTLNISIAQRLVRKLCNHCKTTEPVNPSIFPSGFSIPDNLNNHYVAVGCEHCYQTGYSGRKAIYEILPIDKELMNLIKNNTLSIDEYLESKNIYTLKRNAIDLIQQGITSVEEAFSLLME
ncbi:type II/IV secretion system protein [Flavobacterium salilacus subsp. salilacus]|uniref:GspE/PulE family protein n=1 Tax=Flavobacterium TaxID=237 RepID=UPI0010756145|nr:MULTISPECIES: GspE/PulE family protein [Flavobacterium]KAF2518524.1 type II/IV secretion system protein [Flavobacterium salilacus subsp. salilacus]MBE1615166.1 type II/IV secretion system protein [Flavobacterium sp. SaA2.13]